MARTAAPSQEVCYALEMCGVGGGRPAAGGGGRWRPRRRRRRVIRRRFSNAVAGDGSGEEDEEWVRWVGMYSSQQSILLVGDGDFSFALALAAGFGSGANIVATSLDSYEVLKSKYSRAESNLADLKQMGATILHGIDAEKMRFHTDLKMRKFDRIIFNFPHAGFKGKEDHVHVIKKLVMDFFKSASHMLRPEGEVHVRHKTTGPFKKWNVEQLASMCSLDLIEQVAFNIEDYPGYNNKRGDSWRSDEPFPLGKCCTFKFRIRKLQKNRSHVGGFGQISSIAAPGVHCSLLESGFRTLHSPAVFQTGYCTRAWPQTHLPPIDIAVMSRAQEFHRPDIVQRCQPGFLINTGITPRVHDFHLQSIFQPSYIIRSPRTNYLTNSRITSTGLSLTQHKPQYQITNPHEPLESINYSYFAREYQKCLLGDYQAYRNGPPAAANLDYYPYVEWRHGHFVRDQEGLRHDVRIN